MKCAYKCNVENNQNMNNTFKSSLNKCFKMIRTEFNSGQFYEKWKNKPNIKSICGRRLHRSLYEYQISNNSKSFNNVYGNNQNIQIDNYNNVIDYLDDYSQNDVLNNSKSMITNNEIINTKCNALLRKQRVLYEEKGDVVLTSEGASETLGDIRNKLKTRSETTNGNIYESGLYGPMKGKIDNLSNKPTDLRRTNNTDYGTKIRTPHMNVNDNIKSNIREPEPRTKIVNLKNSGVSKSRVVEYEVVPKIVTTTEEGKVRINRVEYELRAKYEKSKNYEVNNNDRETNDTSSNMETKNEPAMKNPNVTNDMTKPKTDTTQQIRLNSKSNNMNGVKSNVTTSKETPLEKPSNTVENKEGKNPFIDNDLSDKKSNMQDNNKGLKVTTNKTNLKNKLGNNTKQIKQGANPFIENDVSDKKDNLQDSNKGLNVTTNKTNDKTKLEDNTKQIKKGTNPFMDEDELEELLRLEREEKIKNEKKKNEDDNQNKKSNPGVQNKTNSQNKQNSQDKTNKQKKKKKDKIVIDKDDTSDNVSLNSTDPELYYNNDDYYGNGNNYENGSYYGNGSYYDSDTYSNSDDSESGDDNPITVLASEIVDACGNIKGGALKVKDLITEGGPQLLDLTANVVGTKTKDGLNKVKDIVSKKCGIDVESDIDIETETNPLKWHQVVRNKYRKLHFGWKLFVNISPPAALAIIGTAVAITSSTYCAIPFALMAGILFFQVYRLTKKHYYNRKKTVTKKIL
ncbi:hypothetical protein PFAG_05911 [Plasmodium falciparum Santa Lucia]|uniref:Uncharacterized protein n=1 Tax=Plasmodium falciparum Santa Lucia TaxID=478859 RepID=W7FW73_PLAFA|nr:hypothetical protein PFAG_05911 [Plasmodium falciparum Santa Lucia]